MAEKKSISFSGEPLSEEEIAWVRERIYRQQQRRLQRQAWITFFPAASAALTALGVLYGYVSGLFHKG